MRNGRMKDANQTFGRFVTEMLTEMLTELVVIVKQ